MSKRGHLLLKSIGLKQILSSHAKSVAAHFDDVMAHSKQEIELAIHNLKETLEKMNAILANLRVAIARFNFAFYKHWAFIK